MSPPSTVRVAHVSSAHRWSDNRVHLREAASLSAAGYDVHLIAVEHDVELPVTGVTVHQLPTMPRAQRLVRGSVLAVKTALKIRPDVVHLHDPELIWAIVPLRLLGKRVIYDAHEDLPLQVMLKEYLPRPLRRSLSLFARLLLAVASRSTHVVAATEAIAVRFPPNKVSVIRNYPRLRTGDTEWEPARDRPRRVAYNGAMTIERGARVLVDALGDPSFPPGWTAVLAGDISPPSLLEELKLRPGWDKVDYRGVLSPDDARDLLRECQLGIVLSQRNASYLTSLPTKMFEFFAAGIPVIASDFPLWRGIISSHDCGELVDETSPSDVARAIARYDIDPARLARQGANARLAAATTLNWASEEKVLLEMYHRLVEARD